MPSTFARMLQTFYPLLPRSGYFCYNEARQPATAKSAAGGRCKTVQHKKRALKGRLIQG